MPDQTGEYQVIAGNRRLAALRQIHRGSKDDPKISCEVRNVDDPTAGALSLSENFVREAMHPLDEAEDNNAAEREMKRICLNRKNSLFVGNERGGQTAAILSSLTSTCRRHGINPQHYLTQLLTNMPSTPVSQISQWLPDNWKRRSPTPGW
jgi:hypothetical protein